MRNAIGKMKEKRDTKKCRRIQISIPREIGKDNWGSILFIYSQKKEVQKNSWKVYLQ